MSQALRKDRSEDYYNRYINESPRRGTAGRAMRTTAVRTYRIPEHKLYPARPSKAPQTRRTARPAAEIKTKHRRNPKPKSLGADYVVNISKNKKSVVLRSSAIFSILVVGLLCVFSMAFVSTRRFELNDLNAQLRDIRTENRVLGDEIYNSHSLTEIERYATEVLGMIRPDPSQIIYITEPRISFVEQYHVEELQIGPMDVVRGALTALRGFFASGR